MNKNFRLDDLGCVIWPPGEAPSPSACADCEANLWFGKRVAENVYWELKAAQEMAICLFGEDWKNHIHQVHSSLKAEQARLGIYEADEEYRDR